LINIEIVYSFLMGMGWFFLVGWALALLIACVLVFRKNPLASMTVEKAKLGRRLDLEPRAQG
jgi:multisubunit Na+/H+ antiporter MnhG subunit